MVFKCRGCIDGNHPSINRCSPFWDDPREADFYGKAVVANRLPADVRSQPRAQSKGNAFIEVVGNFKITSTFVLHRKRRNKNHHNRSSVLVYPRSPSPCVGGHWYRTPVWSHQHLKYYHLRMPPSLLLVTSKHS
jgi:hypothetical protein